jgi:anti-sigma factor RsiW
MRCQQVIDDFLREYVDGKLSFRERFVFRLHLMHCSRCRHYLTSYRQAIALAKAAGVEPGSAESGNVPDELVKAILSARRARD